MGYHEAMARCCREWWEHADRIAAEVQQRLRRDYTGSQTAACRQFVFWSVEGRAVLTVRVYAPWHSNGTKRGRVVEFSGGHHIQYWTEYSLNDWSRVDRIIELMEVAK